MFKRSLPNQISLQDAAFVRQQFHEALQHAVSCMEHCVANQRLLQPITGKQTVP